MKTNFNPQRYFDGSGLAEMAGLGRGGGGGSAGGGIDAASGNPYGAIAQQGIGAIQSILGFIQAKKAEKQLQKLQSPTYTPNQSIMDYYNKALSRYNVSPQDSALYKQQQKNIQRGVATGLSALQDRKSALMGITNLVQRQNDATLNAEVQAENQRNQRFGVLGQASGMKANEERTAFDINQQQPFERKYNLLTMKAGGGAQIMNAGIQNAYNGFNSLSQRNMIDKYYGG